MSVCIRKVFCVHIFKIIEMAVPFVKKNCLKFFIIKDKSMLKRQVYSHILPENIKLILNRYNLNKTAGKVPCYVALQDLVS